MIDTRTTIFFIQIKDLADVYCLIPSYLLMILPSLLWCIIDRSVAELNNGLAKISHCAQQWKMNFNLYPSKQAQEVIQGEFTATNSNANIWKTKNMLLHFYCVFEIYIKF